MYVGIRKLTVLSAVLTVIGTVSATSVLRAYPAPASPQADAKPSAPTPESSQKTAEKSPSGPETKPGQMADGQPVDSEKRLIRLAELQADADLLEITMDGQKASIQHSMQFLSGRVSRYTVQDRDRGVDWQQSLQKVGELLAQDQESYRKNKIRHALLKFQITRESKALGVSLDPTVPLTELNRRLDRLEEKIDRLAGALTGKAVP
jgi:hypothetical protein